MICGGYRHVEQKRKEILQWFQGLDWKVSKNTFWICYCELKIGYDPPSLFIMEIEGRGGHTPIWNKVAKPDRLSSHINLTQQFRNWVWPPLSIEFNREVTPQKEVREQTETTWNSPLNLTLRFWNGVSHPCRRPCFLPASTYITFQLQTHFQPPPL